MRRFPSITLQQFALQAVKASATWANWVDRLGVQQAVKRACCAQYQEWLEQMFPKDGAAKLTMIDCRHLRDAWLAIGHPAAMVCALLAIGSREDRWQMPEADMLDELNADSHSRIATSPAARL